jgi:predicted CoA-binding protein
MSRFKCLLPTGRSDAELADVRVAARPILPRPSGLLSASSFRVGTQNQTYRGVSEMNSIDRIGLFLSGAPHAVVGASRDRAKYGNKVLRAYMQSGRRVYPVNPTVDRVEQLVAYATLAEIPEPVYGISIVTPPDVTESIITQAAQLGIQHVWMQPGAESEKAIDLAERSGMNVIAGGPCLLVALAYRE